MGRESRDKKIRGGDFDHKIRIEVVEFPVFSLFSFIKVHFVYFICGTLRSVHLIFY